MIGREICCEDVKLIELAQLGFIAGFCEHGDEPLSYIKKGFLDQLNNY
jgi:hypothetical protein